MSLGQAFQQQVLSIMELESPGLGLALMRMSGHGLHKHQPHDEFQGLGHSVGTSCFP